MFEAEKFSTLGAQLKGGVSYQTFGYLGNVDNKATVSFAGFFTPVKNSLRINDIIKVLDTTTDTTFVYWLRVIRIPLAADVEVEEVSTFYSPVETYSAGHVCIDNSTNTVLAGGAVFNGEYQDTLNFSEIIISVSTDQDSATDGLVVQWSADGITVNETDEFSILANNGKTFSFPCNRRYMKLQYTNGATPQTKFNLATYFKRYASKGSSHRITDSIVGEDDAILSKSVLTGLSPDKVFVNIEAAYSNSLKTALYDGETGRRAEVESLGALKTIIPFRLVGTTFSNGTKDPNFWTETVTGTGAVTQAGEITLITGTTANSTAKYATVRKARKITGTTNQFRAVARNVEAPAADCIRRIGPYSSTEGFFMQFNGTTFQVGSRKSGVDILVSNGSLNGNAGATIDFGGGTDFTRIVIEYTALSAKFFIDGILIHTIIPTTTSLTTSLNLPVTMEIINENGNTTNNSYEILFATILRLGELDTEAEYKFISTNTTTICKYNAGRLKRILNVDNAGAVTIYDNTAASGTIIATIDTGKALGTLDFDIPFSTGLTVVTATGAKVVVVYE